VKTVHWHALLEFASAMGCGQVGGKACSTTQHWRDTEKKNGWWGRPLIPEILGQPASVGAKSSIFYLFSLI